MAKREMRMSPVCRQIYAWALLGLWGCGVKTLEDQQSQRLVPSPNVATQALGTNGNFDDGTLNGWTYSSYFNNSGVNVPPQSFADLNLSAGPSNNLTSVLTTTTGPQVADGLDSSSILRVPKYGTTTAVINDRGNGHNVNVLTQTATAGPEDIDPDDGLIHTRFVVAPVLQSGGHAAPNQPYYWISLENVTTSTTLYTQWNYANDPGVPWQVSGNIYYTDWLAFDIAPGNSQIHVGDQLKVTLLASGCSAGGHWGEIYVDGFGAFLPGPAVTAHAPQQANAGSDFTYTYHWRNGAAVAAHNATVQLVLPSGVTFVSVTAPGASCTQPAGGGTGTVTCNLGTLAPGQYGTFAVAVNVPSLNAPSTIDHGNYSIAADGLGTLLGPAVHTTLTSSIQYADLAVRLTDNVAAAIWGQTGLSYQMVVTNLGPLDATAATLTDTLPIELTNSNWTCAATGGGSCDGNSSGSGPININVDLPVGGSVTLTVVADVIAGSGQDTLLYTATAAVPSGMQDPDTTNNVAVDADFIATTLDTVTVSTIGSGAGSVRSSPAVVACSPTCSGDFADGSTVSFEATPSLGSAFIGWSGGACSGSTNPCILTLSGAVSVTAQFDLAYYTVSQVEAGAGSVSCSPVVSAGSAIACTVTPSTGSFLRQLLDNGTDVTSSVSAGTYTISAAAADHLVIAIFGGLSCASNGDCATNLCVDGFCCTDACGSSCGACDVPGSEGLCVEITGAPHGSRGACYSDFVGSACGGSCTGSSFNCVFVPVNTPVPDVCSGATMHTGSVCDGYGNHMPGSSGVDTPCTSNACFGGDGGSGCSCTVDADCGSGSVCLTGACFVAVAQGGSCTQDAQCDANLPCVDGVCCDQTCSGQCEACDVASHVGTCTLLTHGAPHGSRSGCTGSGLCAGSCTGSSPTACTLPSTATTCGLGSCIFGVATLPASCDGAGACSARTTVSCGLYSCGSISCLSQCTQNADCIASAYCAAPSCLPRQANALACTAAEACLAGVCGSNGLCGLAAGDSGCTSATAAILCQSGLCSDAGTCLENGTCALDADCAFEQVCYQNLCVAGQLPNAMGCTTDLVCASQICHSDGQCGVPANASCHSDADCRSGHCTDGHCVTVGALTSGQGLLACSASRQPTGRFDRLGAWFVVLGLVAHGLRRLVRAWQQQRLTRASWAQLLAFSVMALGASSAEAAESGFNLDRLVLAEAGSRWVVADSLDSTPAHWAPERQAGKTSLALRLAFAWAHNPLVIKNSGTNDVLAHVVANQSALTAGVSFYPWKFLRLNVTAPVQLYAHGTSHTDSAHLVMAPRHAASLGDVRLGATYVIETPLQDALRLGVNARLQLPTGRPSRYAGDGVASGSVLLSAAGDASCLAWAAALGVRGRSAQLFAGSHLGSEVLGSAALGLQSEDRLWLVGLEAQASTVVGQAVRSLSSGQLAVDPAVSAHWWVRPSIGLHALLGTSSTEAVGEAQWRALIMAEWFPVPLTPPPPPPPPPVVVESVPEPAPEPAPPVVLEPPPPADSDADTVCRSIGQLPHCGRRCGQLRLP